MPAVRNPKTPYSEETKAIMTEKIRGIFKVCALQGHDTLILGALGCGAFRNPPIEVATIFKQVLAEYNGCFRKVIFAILDGKKWDNCNVFRSVLK